MEILVGMETPHHTISFFSKSVRHLLSVHNQSEITSFQQKIQQKTIYLFYTIKGFIIGIIDLLLSQYDH